jgi:hypothetical protein
MSGQVGAAAERHRIVDDDDLLMVRAADRMVVVEAESDLTRHAPAEPPPRQRIALEGVERRVVPDQNVAAQLRAAADDVGEQRVEPRRRTRRRRGRVGQQVEIGLDVPPDDEDRMTGLEHRVAHPAEVVGGVLDAAEAIGAVHAPAIASRLDDRGHPLAAASVAHGGLTRGAHRRSSTAGNAG